MRLLSTALIATAAVFSQINVVNAQRANTNSMTCSQAQAVVKDAGGIVLSTGQYTYERYVRSRAFCELNQTIKSQWVPTKDANRCRIGYKCVYFSGGRRLD